MARWRLNAAHYLNVPGTEWEYTEISRTSNKQARVRYPVCLFLDPKDGADHNYPGEIIVAHTADRAFRNDIIFTGPPTPDMEPLDDEAQAITDATAKNWIHPIESLPGQGDYSQSLLRVFEMQMKALAEGKSISPAPNQTVAPSEFETLKKQVADLMDANAQLSLKLTEPKPSTPTIERRV